MPRSRHLPVCSSVWVVRVSLGTQGSADIERLHNADQLQRALPRNQTLVTSVVFKFKRRKITLLLALFLMDDFGIRQINYLFELCQDVLSQFTKAQFTHASLLPCFTVQQA